jgi:hypothetical protein
MSDTFYPHQETYDALIAKVNLLAPFGLTEVRGAMDMWGVPDFRLNLGRYRVIGVIPHKTRVDVFMEWRKVFRNRDLYENEPDFLEFEDAFGALGVKHYNSPWHVTSVESLVEGYTDTFLETGMRLIVREIKRIHPETC